jgi:hypothetical protein
MFLPKALVAGFNFSAAESASDGLSQFILDRTLWSLAGPSNWEDTWGLWLKQHMIDMIAWLSQPRKLRL